MASGSGAKHIRVFPFRPTPEQGSFTDFIEQTGTNGLLIEAVRKLYEVPEKPQNPIEWFRLYFKYMVPDRSKEMQETEQLLKTELAEIEKQLMDILEEESFHKEIIQVLEHEYKNITMSSQRNHHYDDFRKYRHHADDYHYRVQPDPGYQASKTDMLLCDEDRENSPLPGLPVDPAEAVRKDEPMYADYLPFYFPEQVQFMSSRDGEEETDEGESSEEGEEEEGASEDPQVPVPMLYPGSMLGEQTTHSSTGGSPSNTVPSGVPEAVREKRKTNKSTASEKKVRGKRKSEVQTPKGHKQPEMSISVIRVASQVSKVEEPPVEVTEPLPPPPPPSAPPYDPDPLLERLEPVDATFWKNDFSLSREKEELCAKLEHFNYNKVQVDLRSNSERPDTGGGGDTLDNQGSGDTVLHMFNNHWILDSHLADPSFADVLVYNEIPYGTGKSANLPFDGSDEDDIGLQAGDKRYSQMDEERGSVASTCECECIDESRCSSSYCPTLCRTATSMSSYKEDDANSANIPGRSRQGTKWVPRNPERDPDSREEEEEEEIFNETVAPSARFEPDTY